MKKYLLAVTAIITLHANQIHAQNDLVNFGNWYVLKSSVYAKQDTIFALLYSWQEGYPKPDTLQARYLISKPKMVVINDNLIDIKESTHKQILAIYQSTLKKKKK